jgi:hypothetical protein
MWRSSKAAEKLAADVSFMNIKIGHLTNGKLCHLSS